MHEQTPNLFAGYLLFRYDVYGETYPPVAIRKEKISCATTLVYLSPSSMGCKKYRVIEIYIFWIDQSRSDACSRASLLSVDQLLPHHLT